MAETNDQKKYILVNKSKIPLSGVVNDCSDLCVPATKGEPLSSILNKICEKVGSQGSGVAGTSGTSGTSGQSGTSGTSGATGSSGASGTSGTSGLSGTSGTSGATGSSGASGTSGTSGAAGTSGTSGATGATGTSGTSGVNGTSGSNGTSGTSGIAGTSGTSGNSGASGTSGTSGVDGSAGTSGTSGNAGTSGTSGADGTSGVNGTSGLTGTSGTSGTNGTSGTSGSNGTSGTSGTSGTTGTSGTSGNGTSGTSGSSGTSGNSGTSGVSGTSGTNGTSGTSGANGSNGTSGTSGSTGTSGTSGGGTIDGSGVSNRLTYWTDVDTISYLDTATYPSLAEVAYVKGVTSAIQTQINAKQASDTQLTSLAGLSYTGNALKVIRVNAGETDFELATVSSGPSFGTDNQIPYTNAGGTDFDYSANLTFNGTALALAGNQTISQGTITTDVKALDISSTWNNAAVAFTGIKLNATQTASASTSLLMDLQKAGTSVFKVARNGAVTIDPGSGFGSGSSNPVLTLRAMYGTSSFYGTASSALALTGSFQVDGTLYLASGIGFQAVGQTVDLNSGNITKLNQMSFTGSSGYIKMYHDYNGAAVQADQGIIMRYANRTSGSYPRAAFQVYKSSDSTEIPFLVSSQGFAWLRNSKTDEATFTIRNATSQTAPTLLFQNGAGSEIARLGTVVDDTNIGFGLTTLNAITTGQNNTAIGREALKLGTSIQATTAIGSGALAAATTNGSGNNVAVGYLAGGQVNGSSESVFIGSVSGYGIVSGADYSTFVGSSSGQSSVTGAGNTGVGHSSGAALTSGANNVLIGRGTHGVTTGSTNIVIGYNNSPTSVTGSDQLKIGEGILGVNINSLSTVGIGIGIDGTTTSALTLRASTTSRSSLNIASGTAPSSPVDGDIWFDGTDIKMRIGGTTKTFTLV